MDRHVEERIYRVCSPVATLAPQDGQDLDRRSVALAVLAFRGPAQAVRGGAIDGVVANERQSSLRVVVQHRLERWIDIWAAGSRVGREIGVGGIGRERRGGGIGGGRQRRRRGGAGGPGRPWRGAWPRRWARSDRGRWSASGHHREQWEKGSGGGRGLFSLTVGTAGQYQHG